jgi:hypothetical protein
MGEMPEPGRIANVAHTQKAEGVEVRTWTADRLDLKVRRVCGICNHGWMSRLEKAARPVLLPLMAGKSKSLVPVEQEVVAVWAIKTALMCEFINPGPRGATDEHFRAFYDGLKPPPSAHVWLARFHVPERLDYSHRVLQFPSSPDGAVPSRLGYLSAFIINHLVLYVMDVASTSGAITRTTVTAEGQRRTLPIQPIEHLIVRWPPEFSVDAQGVEDFMLSIAPTRTPEE